MNTNTTSRKCTAYQVAYLTIYLLVVFLHRQNSTLHLREHTYALGIEYDW